MSTDYRKFLVKIIVTVAKSKKGNWFSYDSVSLWFFHFIMKEMKKKTEEIVAYLKNSYRIEM